MKYIVLSDTHFGVKNNSITWMNSQLGFIYKEFANFAALFKFFNLIFKQHGNRQTKYVELRALNCFGNIKDNSHYLTPPTLRS